MASPQLLGPTHIGEGWITIRDQQALGPAIVDRTLGETVQPDSIKVDAGASLQLLPITGNINLPNRLILTGQGITHPFAMLEQGAVLSLGGNNTLSGDIQIADTSTAGQQVGIGVDDPTNSDPTASTLTTTGSVSDFIATPINLSFTASGGFEEQRFPIDTGGTSGTITIDFRFYSIPDDLRIYYPPRAQGGTLIYDTGLISDPVPPPNPPPPPPPIVVSYGPGSSTFVEIVMNEGGNPDGGTAWDLLSVQIVPKTPPGGVGLVKMGSRLLSMQGDGTYTGDVDVQSGTLQVKNDSALGRDSSGTETDPTTQTYSDTNTTVEPGALLQLDSTNPQNAGGFTAGDQVWNEHLILNGAGQQVAVNGSVGTFTLTFNGQTTTDLPVDATAAQVQTALNALASIGGVGGTATVTQNGNVYTVVFGGTLAGLNNPLLIATASAAPGNLNVLVSGTNFPLSVLGQDNLWRGPITLNTDTTIDVADQSRLTLYGPIDDAGNPSPSGSSLTVGQVGTGNTGELVLSGNNTYRGTTYVKQGILTITNGKALGGIGGSEVQTVTLGGATGGTFTLTFDGQTTTALSRNATAPQIQTALNALSTIGGAGGTAAVTRAGNVITITYGGVLAGADQPQITAAGSGGTTATWGTTADGYGGTVVNMARRCKSRGASRSPGSR